MSALGQKRTWRQSFNHLIGAPDERIWDIETKGFCCLQIDNQGDFRGLMHRQVARLLTLKNAAGLNASLTIRFRWAVAITHKAAGNGKVACRVNCRSCIACGQRSELL